MTSRRPSEVAEQALLADHPRTFLASLILWAIGGSLFLALAIPPLREIVQSVDDRIWEMAVDSENSLLVALAEVMDFIGSTWVIAPIMAIVTIYLIVRRRWKGLAYWVIAMVVSQLLIGPVKALYARPRPPLPLVATTGYSFPSGHSVAGAAVAIALVIVLVPAGPRRRNLEVLAAFVAFAIALSRVYLRAHWFSDVAAGAAMGAAVAIGAAVLVQWYNERRNRSPDTG